MWTIRLKIGQNRESISNFIPEGTLVSGEIIHLIVLREFGKTKPEK